MKKLACLLLILLTVKAYSQTTNDSLATIIFYRNPSRVLSSESIKLRDSLGNVIRLHNRSYYVFQCKPGEHRFTVNKQKYNNVYVSAKPGKTYYYKASVSTSFWSNHY